MVARAVMKMGRGALGLLFVMALLPVGAAADSVLRVSPHADLKVLDRRMRLINWATALSVTSAVLTCLVVVLLFAANLIRTRLATEIAWLFMASMLTIGAGFAVFLIETTIAARAVRIRSELLQHRVEDDG